MIRRILTLMLALTFAFSAIAAAAQTTADTTLIGKLNAVEISLYGNAQTGALLERLTKLENGFYGAPSSEALVTRIDALYAAMFENTYGRPSVLTKVNAVEWAIMHEVASGPLKNRIESLETTIEGSPQTGTYDARIASLSALAFPDGTVNVAEKAVPKDTLIKIKLLTEIDSKTSGAGNEIKYQIAEDVAIDGVLVFAKGAEGNGKVVKVSQSQNFGRDAKVDLDFESVLAIDGNRIDTFLGEKAQKETETLAIAAGATVAGLVVLGPVGIVTGAFIKGKNVKIPEGSELYIQTKSDITVNGIQIVVM